MEELALRERLGKRIRARSAARGIKPADLAAAAGIALSQQYRIEAGELTADFLYLAKVAALLETGIDELLADAYEATAPLDPGEQTLLDNYRHSAPADQAALKAASGARAAAAGTKRAKAG